MSDLGRDCVKQAIAWAEEDLEGDVYPEDREEWVSRLIRDDRTDDAMALAIGRECRDHGREYGLPKGAGERLWAEAQRT